MENEIFTPLHIYYEVVKRQLFPCTSNTYQKCNGVKKDH